MASHIIYYFIMASVPIINEHEIGNLPQNSMKEQFSYAFLHAITSAVGCELNRDSTDYKSVDARITTGGLISGVEVPDPEIAIQLKATSNGHMKNDSIKYALPLKNYNELRAKTRVPRILLLVILPPNPKDWIIHDEGTHLNAQGYYCNLRGQPDTSNTTNVTISIPITNLFTTDVLDNWIHKIAKGEELWH